MNLWFRLLRLRLTMKRRSRLTAFDVGRIRMRVWPRDLDQLGHMNNGVYLTIMDLGRYDLNLRSGLWPALMKAGIYPVVGAQTITYRRSLKPWQLFDLETRLIGFDDRSVYCEQRFVVDGEICAQAVVRARFLQRTGGTVSMDELGAALGEDVHSLPAPEWAIRWAADTALPSNRRPAPSVWA
ncbi:thioesterase family protein [Schumannella luteola]|uniref:Acyl-CoA thioesterase FadM n=1 Tax=Schumannella luteola TaxID=472059 RepID=A0A852Y6E1_9MICO|nr:acyl-CoA thioesterase FadM [Schumannella luteola]